MLGAEYAHLAEGAVSGKTKKECVSGHCQKALSLPFPPFLVVLLFLREPPSFTGLSLTHQCSQTYGIIFGLKNLNHIHGVSIHIPFQAQSFCFQQA